MLGAEWGARKHDQGPQRCVPMTWGEAEDHRGVELSCWVAQLGRVRVRAWSWFPGVNSIGVSGKASRSSCEGLRDLKCGALQIVSRTARILQRSLLQREFLQLLQSQRPWTRDSAKDAAMVPKNSSPHLFAIYVRLCGVVLREIAGEQNCSGLLYLDANAGQSLVISH